MTRREVFLQADPQAVNDMIGFVEIEFNGRVEHFRSQRPFTVCKGLKWFAEGERYDAPKEDVLTQIAHANSKFKFSELQLNAIYQSRQATLCEAIEALGLSNEPTIDERVNQWLDQSIACNENEDINTLATNIISDLIQEPINK